MLPSENADVPGWEKKHNKNPFLKSTKKNLSMINKKMSFMRVFILIKRCFWFRTK